MRAVLVGATGAVGTEMLSILEQREFPLDDLVLVASARSAGRMIPFRGRDHEVQALSPEVFEGADIALFDVPDEISKEWAPVAAARGAVAVDNSAAWRLDPDVPLVVPEVNPQAAHQATRGIIASANCTTLAMVVPLAALHRAAGVRRVIASSYQSASGSGQPGIDQLWEETQIAAKEPDAVTSGSARDVLRGGAAFPHPIALNVIPKCGSVRDAGHTSEELKLCYETRKIMDLPELPVSATCVRVPVVVAHGVAVHAEFERELSPDEARSVLAAADGVEVVDDLDNDQYPTPLEAAGKDPCYVGRIRQDLFDPKTIVFFSVADNLRKGAALNTVQIAELLLP